MHLNLIEFIIEIIYLKKIKDGAYVINLDEYSDTETHWITSHVLNNKGTYSYNSGIEHIPKQIKKFIVNKNI